MRVWLVYDERGILDPEGAVVQSVAKTLDEAISDCRVFGSGAVHGPYQFEGRTLDVSEDRLTFWLSGGREWAEREGKEVYE